MKLELLPQLRQRSIIIDGWLIAIQGIGVILPLENKMKNPQAFLPWNGVLNTAMIITCCLYISVGFYGYLKYGKHCLGSITLNLPSDRWINDVRERGDFDRFLITLQACI